MPEIADGLTHDQIDALLQKWPAILPQPFATQDLAAGSRDDVSILPSEFALTQVWDRPLTGRLFCEEVIRETSRSANGGRTCPPCGRSAGKPIDVD